MKSMFESLQGYKLPEAKKYTKKRGQSERAELIQKFLDALNPPRIESGFKKLSAARVSMMLSDAQLKTTHDIYVFYRECENAKNFSKYFWWALNPKSKITPFPKNNFNKINHRNDG